MDKVKNPILAPNKLIAVLGYIFFSIFGGSIFVIVIAVFYNKAKGLDLNYIKMIEVLGETDFAKIDEAYRQLYVVSNAFGNMVTYLFMLLIVGFFMRNYIIKDALALKEKKNLFWIIPLFAVAGYGLSILVDFIVGILVRNTSVNQSSIVGLIENGGAFPMFFAVVICAPIVEELIYRKAIFEFLDKQHISISYVVSILLFALPHMISTFALGVYSPLENLLMTIPYAFSGFLLCLSYHLCNKNIYASWFMHLVNNLLAFILIFVGV